LVLLRRSAAALAWNRLCPFCGSGTTIAACERTGRQARCMELDPLYVDVAVRR